MLTCCGRQVGNDGRRSGGRISRLSPINAFDTRGSLHSEIASKLARALNAVQLTGPTDAVFHTANIIAALSNH